MIGGLLGVGLRVGAAFVAFRYLQTRPLRLALGLGRGAANAMIAVAFVTTFMGPNVAEVCTASGVCFTPPAAIAATGAIIALGTFAANALRKPESKAGPAGAADAPVLEENDETRSLTRDLILPLVALAALAAGAVAYFAPQGDRGMVLAGIVGGLALRALARVVYYLRQPATFYPVIVGVLRGGGFAVAAVFALLEFVTDGPGMPLTAWQLGLFIVCFSVLRQAKTLVKGPGLPILITLLTAIGAGAWGGFNAYRNLFGWLPGAGQLLWLAALGYGMVSLRALLAFASEDEAGKGAGWAEWLRANFWRNLVFVGLLVAYLAFRDNLAASIRMFPIIEFTLGLGVLGFVLTRVRGRIRASLTEKPTAAEWKPHEQRVERVSEPEHDRVHDVVGAFLTTGARREEYAELLAKAARADGDAARAYRDPVMSFRERRRHGHLPYAAAALAAIVIAAGLAVALYVSILTFIELTQRASGGSGEVEIVGIVPLGLALAGAAVWFTQGVAARNESVGGLAAAGLLGTGFVVAAILGFLANTIEAARQAGAIPPGQTFVDSVAWFVFVGIGILAVVGLGVPGYRAWRLARQLRDNTIEREGDDRAERAREGFRTHTKFAIAWIVTAFLITVPANFLLEILATSGAIPIDFPDEYRRIQPPILVLLASLGAMSLVLLVGYSFARPLVAREAETNRARRLELHRAMMQAATGASALPPPAAVATSPATPLAAARAAIVGILPFMKKRE